MNWLQKTCAATGECFKEALWWAARNQAELVHGMVTNVEGKRFNHAWAEKGDQVIDITTSGNPMEKTRWYELLQAEVTARYPDAHEAMALGIRQGHWGPWE